MSGYYSEDLGRVVTVSFGTGVFGTGENSNNRSLKTEGLFHLHKAWWDVIINIIEKCAE